ncbi:L-amino-acid oxidase [Aulographum hederae CBS 113979]|uniref:L-amino-acid oxidase n=1 Tax=Aulographum hederae CBS 113979 TaxID=1176131 RepID=A0A6G1GL15_9PEZI|nr:L-amino-acid oxidase [Aulographum hederae CBS 113979]
MLSLIPHLAALFYCATAVSGQDATFNPLVSFKDIHAVEAAGMQNIHIQYLGQIDGDLSIHYGSCSLKHTAHAHHRVGRTHVGRHPLAKRHVRWSGSRPTRFVWLPPADIESGHCLHAFAEDVLVGTSQPIRVAKRKIRRGVAFADVADSEGPWFDGVEYLQQKEPDETFVAEAKGKSIGIIGGGMSGLMTSLLLSSVGIQDWKILEASQRVGGRVHTSYLNGTRPDQYQYQEMGPMRFPVSIELPGTNESIPMNDHRMVFQLADHLNELNGNSSEYAVNFIPWIQSASGDPATTSKRLPDGTVPSVGDLEASPMLADNVNATYSNETAVALAQAAYDAWVGLDEEKLKSFALNIFEAHKQAIKDGLFDYSEAGYLRYKLRVDLNITDQAASTASNNPSWPYENVYFSATTWKTIDQGLSQLPRAFEPLVLNKTSFGVKVSEMAWDPLTKKISVHWRPNSEFSMTTASESFDHVVVAVPFTRVRLWRLPPYSSLLTRAIKTLNYVQSCKVALHYKTRFWEHLPEPILGGCGSTDIPGVGSVCYPSYTLNASGPGVILGNYAFGAEARSLASLTETEHVALIQRAMVEIHGEVAAEQWTGNYDRICWENDEFQAGAWCEPLVGQQELYLPAYFRTEMGTVFVGEHTSWTHAWIWSALESAVRGTAQLLLDMGLVDEAKEVTGTWMARWLRM